jgi:hypothetical protein
MNETSGDLVHLATSDSFKKKKDISGFYIFEKRNQNVASDVYHKRAKGQQLHGIVLPLA